MEKNKMKYKKRKSGKSKISFDEEVVTKDSAKDLNPAYCKLPISNSTTKETEPEGKKKTKRKRKAKEAPADVSNDQKPKKKKRPVEEQTIEDNGTVQESLEAEIPAAKESVKPQKESIRSRKRKKQAKLLEDKKNKVELDLQQKSLNYLSKWKHSKTEWKFEKLKQIWLQQNLLDLQKIPNEFWETVVEYFSSSKGMSRKSVLDQAIKFIEEDENVAKEEQEEDYKVKLQRARDIVQYLQ
ncbi:uncharacterized protein C7orf50 homolog [Dendroctonus ponderosae]